MKTPDYLSYTSYKKKKNNGSKKGLLVFVTTFFATLLLLTIIARGLTPNVDVSIGDDANAEPGESGLGVKRFIDDRLKMIQMEDAGEGSSEKSENKKTAKYDDESFDSFSRELDEKVSLPKQRNDSEAVSEDEDYGYSDPTQNSQTAQTPPRPKAIKNLSTPITTTKMSKVFVGNYSTVEQAKVAQGILLDSGFNITPFIKDLGGSYTLQVGSYSNRSKAEGLSAELLRNNFPARVVQE